MKSLVIYNNTGFIYDIIYGEESVPENMDKCASIVDIPSYMRLLSMDTSKDPAEPVFDEQPDTELDRVGTDLEATKEDVTSTQIALTEVYEALLAKEV